MVTAASGRARAESRSSWLSRAAPAGAASRGGRRAVDEVRQGVESLPRPRSVVEGAVDPEVQVRSGGGGVAAVADEADDGIGADLLSDRQAFGERVEVRVEVAQPVVTDDGHRESTAVALGHASDDAGRRGTNGRAT